MRFERMTREHAAAANALTNLVFGIDRSLEHFMWKFWENPAGDPVAWVGVDDATGEIHSENLGLAKKVRINGEDARCIMVCESATSPKARGGGRLYKGATSCTGLDAGAQGCVFAYGGQSTDEAIKIGRRWFGYRVAFVLQVWEKRLSYRAALSHRLGALGRLISPLADLFLSLKEPGIASFQFEEIHEFGEEFNELWFRYRDNYRLCFSRSADALNWRYAKCPVGPTRTVLARRNGTAMGYIVWRERTIDGVHVATVLDLWHGNEPGVAQALLAHTAKVTRAAGLVYLRFAVREDGAEHKAMASLKNTRKSPFEKEDRVIVTPLPMPIEEATPVHYDMMRTAIDGSNWFYTQGDCDFLD